MYYANCHFHSTHSDGQFRPLHLARIAYGMGYRALALTDHDVMSGNTELLKEAKLLGMTALTGAEITCRLTGDHSASDAGFHLVGLGIDTDYPPLVEFVNKLCDWRNVHTRAIFEQGVRDGLLRDITWDEVLAYNPGCKWFCNEQVFHAMDLKGVFDKTLQHEYFLKVFHGPFAKTQHIQEPLAVEAITMIRRAGGIPILAHPHRQTQYLPKLHDMGLLGVEVVHHLLDAEDEKLAREAADALHLYRSGGSDHSGIMGGCSLPYTADEGWGVTEEDFFAMAERKLG